MNANPIELVASVSREGGGMEAWSLYMRSLDQRKCMEFLESLAEKSDSGKKTVFKDNLRVHNSRRLQYCRNDLDIAPLFNLQ